LQQESFRILREQYPERLKKLIVIHGDITIEELALSVADKKRLTSKVSVVFHMAANVRFDLSLKTAIQMNTMSTINVVTLVKQVRTRYWSRTESNAKNIDYTGGMRTVRFLYNNQNTIKNRLNTHQ